MRMTMPCGRIAIVAVLAALTAVSMVEAQSGPADAEAGAIEYRVLATNRTSTMEKEFNGDSRPRYRSPETGDRRPETVDRRPKTGLP